MSLLQDIKNCRVSLLNNFPLQVRQELRSSISGFRGGSLLEVRHFHVLAPMHVENVRQVVLDLGTDEMLADVKVQGNDRIGVQ